MGRYYDGDISGKFMFAVQDSYAPSRFGGKIDNECQCDHYIHYYFDTENLSNVKAEISLIENEIDVKNIDDFFELNDGYTDSQLLDAGISFEMLSDYADLKIGIEIRDCIIKNGKCSFDAEL